jgi:hypothetical protein
MGPFDVLSAVHRHHELMDRAWVLPWLHVLQELRVEPVQREMSVT